MECEKLVARRDQVKSLQRMFESVDTPEFEERMRNFENKMTRRALAGAKGRSPRIT